VYALPAVQFWESGTKFCEECGAKLVRVCPKGALTLQSKTSPWQVAGESNHARRYQHPTPNTQAQAEAEACFLKAIEIARRQQAKSLELRAVMNLSRLWQWQGNKEEARRRLAQIYGWFTEGFDTKDLQEAKALLEELSHWTIASLSQRKR
jgi:predicted ATPase